MAFGYQILGFGAGGAGGPPYNIQYLVVAGGGSGSDFGYGGGGGAGGGYRTLASKSFEVVPGKNYTVTIGAGGTGQAAPNCAYGTKGSDSVFDTITSTGGGGGGGVNFAPGCVPFTCQSLAAGGSGGGGGAYFRTSFIAPSAGTGNTPPVSPSQGYGGGLAASNGPPSSDGNPSGRHGGGGGGAGGTGGAATTGSPGAGGSGVASCISGSSVTRAAGGAGDSQGSGNPSPNQPDNSGDGSVGTVAPIGEGGSGGSGVVIIRRATADSSTTSGTVTTSGDDTIHSFTSPGTFQG